MRVILVDGGSYDDNGDADQHDVGHRVVPAYLHYRGIKEINLLVLTNPHGAQPENSTVNNYSAGVGLTYDKTLVLLNGDAQEEVEQSMLAAYGDLLADVLKSANHGAGNATCDTWLERVYTTFTAIPRSLRNHFAHPNPATHARLKAHDVIVFRTDLDGAVTFAGDGRSVSARAFSK